MSAPERSVRKLCGWGGRAHSTATLVRVRRPAQVAEAMRLAGSEGGLIARGAGRSYGDAAQNGAGLVVDMTCLDFIELDEQSMSVRAGAGATLGQLLKALAGSGLTLPVLPGTRHVTLGGAIAADVHGKNHRADGSFGHHVQSMVLCTPDEQLRKVSREREPDLFYATLGGMGLTGVIVEANVAVAPLSPPPLLGDIDRTTSIDEALRLMEGSEHRYSIAWLDLLSGGSAFGRGVLLRCNDAREGSDCASGHAAHDGGLGAGASGRISLPGRPRLNVPEGFPSWVLGRPTARAYNALRWRRSQAGQRKRPIGVAENFFPLDALGSWNRLYGRGGLLQYQFAVPEHGSALLSAVTELLRAARQPMYLAVLKRFGEGSGGLLSFPAPGWTLAIDMRADPEGLHDALDEADELVANAGGRVYLAKDSRLRPELLRRMYPHLTRFLEVKQRVDPEGVLRSDMASRLGLLQGAGR